MAEFIRRAGRQYLTHRVYMALCAAPNHPLVGDVLRRVTQRRIDALIATFSEMGLPESEAWHRAHMAYAAYIGYLQLEAQGQTPERDTPERVQEYVDRFNTAFIGLSGTQAELESIWRSYFIYRESVSGTSAAGYVVDHTARVILIDQQGNMRVSFGYDMPVEDIVHDLKLMLKN